MADISNSYAVKSLGMSPTAIGDTNDVARILRDQLAEAARRRQQRTTDAPFSPATFDLLGIRNTP